MIRPWNIFMKTLGSGTGCPTKIGCGLMRKLAESSIVSVIIVVTEIIVVAVTTVVNITITAPIVVRDVTVLKIGIWYHLDD